MKKILIVAMADSVHTARTLDLENLDLPDLIGRAVASLAPEELEATLRDLGWTVSRPPTDI